MNNRLLFATAALPCTQARAVLALFCAEQKAARFERTRGHLENRFHKALVRVLKFAKHETLRKLHRYMHSNRPLHGQETQPDHPDAIKITFNPDELRQDLFRMLQTELPDATSEVADATMAAVGYTDPWAFPAQATLDLIARRQNLISGVPDEIFQTIQSEISAGLNAGESIGDLSKRITSAFDEIDKGRAKVIAQTETAAAYSYSSDKAARAAGVGYKKWLHSVIPKVPRPDHLAIHGLILPIDEVYPVGDPPLMYPHDPGGAAEDVINCYCISIPVTAEEYRAQ